MKKRKKVEKPDWLKVVLAKETLEQQELYKETKRKKKMLKEKLKQIEEGLTTEQFKPLFGFEGLYEIGNKGTIVALDRVVDGKNGSKRNLHSRIKTTTINRGGYVLTRLCDDYGNNKSYEVHRLVAKTWVHNPYGKPQVNHINGDKTDNRVSNLEWMTASENIQHAIKEGLFKTGEQCVKAKLTEIEVLKIRANSNLTQKQLGDLFNVTPTTIHKIKHNLIWKHI